MLQRAAVLMLTLLISSQAFAQKRATKPKAEKPIQATEIIRQGEDTVRGQSAQALISMTIKKAEFTRQLKLRAWNVGSSRAMVEILAPQKEEGVSSLRTDSQMWNYFPNTDQTVRVPPSLMLQAWMGSDFTNDDLMKLSSLTRDYNHKLVGTEKKDGETVVKILCTPKPGAPVVWGKVMHWARLKDSLPVEQRFYDDEGKWVRTMKFSGYRKMDDRVIPTMSKVTTAENPGQYTIVHYHRILYDRKIDAEIFNTDALRRNSQQGKMLLSQWFTRKLNKPGVRLSLR